ncbi:MAG: fibronectin type III domain-containing protein [Prevotella sp.]
MSRFKLLLLALFISATNAMAQEPTVILSENFDAFTEGSVDSPATVDISRGASPKLGQVLTDWTGKYVYEAGGSLKIDDWGNLKTANYDMSANSGIIRISVRVKCAGDGGLLKVSVGNNQPSQIFLPDSEWHELSFVTDGGEASQFLKIEPYLALNGIFLDSLVVETSEQFFISPEAYQPEQADGTSFTAEWSSVNGATNYLLDVYTKNGETFDYLLKDEEVTTNSYDVTGLDPTKTYYFTVRATNGTGVSEYSNEIEVVKVISELAAPVALDATDVTENGFVAHYNAAEDAESYVVNVYKNTTMNEAGDVTLLSESFDGVTQGSYDNVYFGDKLTEYLDAYTNQPGWFAAYHVFASGAIGLSPFGSEASLTTPSMDLSGNDGQFTFKVRMASLNFGTEVEDDSVQIKVLEGGTSNESPMTVKLNKGFNDYEFTLSGGTDTQVEILYTGDYKVWIEDVEVIQTLPAGTVFKTLVQQQAQTELECPITLEEPFSEGVTYSYGVKAEGRTVVEGEIVDISSKESNIIEVKLPTAITETHTGKIVDVYYYNMAGMKSTKAHAGVNIKVTKYSDGTVKTEKLR